jgi:hypothetical protein
MNKNFVAALLSASLLFVPGWAQNVTTETEMAPAASPNVNVNVEPAPAPEVRVEAPAAPPVHTDVNVEVPSAPAPAMPSTTNIEIDSPAAAPVAPSVTEKTTTVRETNNRVVQVAQPSEGISWPLVLGLGFLGLCLLGFLLMGRPERSSSVVVVDPVR